MCDMREKLLRVESAVNAVIGLCARFREGEPDGSGYRLLVDLENQAHNMNKQISDVTEGELKKLISVDFKRQGGTA
jgi:hypothetical protein